MELHKIKEIIKVVYEALQGVPLMVDIKKTKLHNDIDQELWGMIDGSTNNKAIWKTIETNEVFDYGYIAIALISMYYAMGNIDFSKEQNYLMKLMDSITPYETR